MREEKSKGYLIFLLVAVMLLMVPLSYLRVIAAAFQADPEDIGAATGVYSVITDRTGGVIFRKTCTEESLHGNLLGSGKKIQNSVYPHYSEQLRLSGINPFLGMGSFSDQMTSTLKTTLLDTQSHIRIKEVFGPVEGCCFAYDYVTGEVLMALSLPSNLEDGATETGFVNRCLSTCYIPGSTMKVVAAACALEQDPELEHFTFTCTGSTELPDGNTVNCHSVHGTIGMVEALGKSCNCYMAGLIQKLNVKQTRQTLEELRIHQTGAGVRGHMGRLSYRGSTTQFTSASAFDDVWSLIGQGLSAINPVGMARIAGAVANGGQAAVPYLVGSVTDAKGRTTAVDEKAEPEQLLAEDTARLLSGIWKDAVDSHYRTQTTAVDIQITHAKTGTSQLGDGSNNRFLLGVMEDYHVAFFIAAENVPAGSTLPVQAANILAQAVAAME